MCHKLQISPVFLVIFMFFHGKSAKKNLFFLQYDLFDIENWA